MIYAIGDLHLSHSSDKPMDVFGAQWEGHAERIKENWNHFITEDDVVLIPGDISWAMTLNEAEEDIAFIGGLPGRKIMIRGNHDYWWNGISKVRTRFASGMYAIQNDALALDGVAYCGTRGWLLPFHPRFTSEDERLYLRESERLRMSLDNASSMKLPIVCMMHYPPCGPSGEATRYTELLEEYGVKFCVYGHLHGNAHRFAFEGVVGGVQYRLTSADYINFSPLRIANSHAFL